VFEKTTIHILQECMKYYSYFTRVYEIRNENETISQKNKNLIMIVNHV